MEELKIVKNFMNDREFRNYVNTMFYKRNYQRFKIDDVRLSDKNDENDNDIIVYKDNVKYTVQTYLNGKIGDKEIKETQEDMLKEKVSQGIIVTNLKVPRFIKNKASKINIIVLDQEEFKKGVYS